MSWVEHSIWWHVYPLGFGGAPIHDEDTDPAPRLRRLLNWLDYAVELGASGLQLGPVFTSGSHGYDSIDQFHIDPRLGTDDDFDELVARCRERGLRVLLDGVFNHLGAEHPLFREAMRDGRDSSAAAMFAIDWDAPGGPQPRVFEGHDALVELDHRSPAAADYVTKVLDHWLDRGIDGWRLDAAYAVDPAFWGRVLPGVRERHPDAWLVGEMLHGDYADYVARSTLDSVTQYELWKAIWSSLKDRNFFELDWTLTRHNQITAAFTPATFVGNHDVTRIASIVGPEGAVLALTILMTVAGIPSIYYGDEQGYVGVKEERIGGDDEVRPEFPERPDDLADWGVDILRVHQDLIGLRRRHPWLVTARTEQTSLSNTRYTYRAHAADGAEALEVELDVEDEARAVVRSAAGEVLWQFGV
ncbi:MAG TPA: alpha-amylase family protein [Aldersonia sp.]